MRPTAVLIAILFGSATAISFGLMATAVVFLFLRNEYPELQRELRPLLISCAWFATLAASSGAALYSTLRSLRWRRYAQAGAATLVVAVLVAYWP